MKIQHQKHSPLCEKAEGKSVPIGFPESMNAQCYFFSHCGVSASGRKR